MKFNYRKLIYLLIILLTSSLIIYKMPSFSQRKYFIVHYIDVGQGDSILIESEEKNLLIDAGTPESCDFLIKYLKSQNIKKINSIIITHPHDDHIGGIAKIIKTFPIDSLYSPKVIHTNESFKNLVNVLKEKKLNINVLSTNKSNNIDLGKNTNIEIFSPSNELYENLNNYSPIMRISYGETSFLFTGDAEEEAEKEVLKNNYNIKSDVLKVGHHGSHTSSTKDFLNKISPKIAIISAGLDNSYGHPNQSTLNKLKERNIKIFRTDEDGTIKISSNGKELSLVK